MTERETEFLQDKRFWLAVTFLVAFLVYLLLKYPS